MGQLASLFIEFRAILKAWATVVEVVRSGYAGAEPMVGKVDLAGLFGAPPVLFKTGVGDPVLGKHNPWEKQKNNKDWAVHDCFLEKETPKLQDFLLILKNIS